MKVAISVFSYFPYGGLQRDLMDIVRCCLALGDEVLVLAQEWQGEKPQGISLCVHPGKGLTAVARRRDFVRMVLAQKATWQADVLLGFNRMPGLDFYFAADACFAAKAFGARSWWYRLTPRARQYLDFERAVFGAQATTRLLLLSERQQADYQHWYGAGFAERALQLPPGIDARCRAGADAAHLRALFRRQYGLMESQFAVVQLGSGFRIKGVDRALRALASLPAPLRQQVRYFLGGADNPDAYCSLARKLGIDELVTVLGPVDDVPTLLQGADLMLHPAYSESAGKVIVEALVAGLPVLVTDTCGYASHVSAAAAGMVCPEPFQQAMLDQMLADMLDQGRLSVMRANGIAYGQQHDLYHQHEYVARLLRHAAIGQESNQ
jgi:UDP-glucose:(heptosyl)LPS alpha-1,3-glucosyltransferase